MTKRARKRLFVLIFIVLLGAGSFAGFRYWRSVQTERLIAEKYRLGEQYYQLGDYENALKNWSYYLSKREDDGETLVKFAECRLNVPMPNDKHILEGARLLKTAVTLLPDDPKPLYKLIELYGQLGYLTERLDVCNRLLRLLPDDSEALIARVQTLYTMGGRQHDALEAAEQLIAAEPDNPEAHEWKLRILLERQGNEAQATEYVESIVESHADNPSFLMLQARTYASVGRTEDAKKAARAAASFDITDSDVLRDLVTLLDQLRLSNLADEKLSQTLESVSSDSDIATVIVERAWKAGNHDLAISYLPAEGVPVKDQPDELLGWASFLRQDINTDLDSDAAFGELLTRQTDGARYWVRLLRGRQAMLESNWVEARHDLRQAASIRTSESLTSMLLGETNRALAESDRALFWLEMTTRDDPTWSAPHQLLALCYLEAGRLAEAQREAETALGLAMNAGRTGRELAVLAEVYLQLLEVGRGDPQRTQVAVQVLRQILEQNPDNPTLIAIVARALIITDDVAEAENLIRRLLDEELVPATEELLDLVDACKQHELPYADSLLMLGGNDTTTNATLLLRLANRSAQQGRLQEGKKFLQDSIDTAVDDGQRLQRELALASYLDEHDQPDALEYLKRLASENPESALAQRVLLDSRSAWRQKDAVTPAIERLRALTGEDATGWRKYEARRLLTFDPTPNNASQVIELLLATVRSNPADIRAQALYAEANIILEDPNAAIRTLSAAVDANLLQVTLYPRLIELLKQEGRMAEAEQRLLEFSNRYIPIDNLALRRQRVSLLADNALWKPAIEEMKKIAAIGESSDLAFLADLYRRSGQMEKARATYEEAVALPDVNESVFGSAATFFAKTGDYERGLDLLNSLPDSINEVDKNLMIAAFMEETGKAQAAEDLLEETADSTDDPRAWAALARYMIRRQRYPDADTAIERGLASSPDHRDLQSLKSLVSALQGGEIEENIIDQMGNSNDPESRAAYQKLLAADQFQRQHPDDHRGYLAKLREVTSEHPSVFEGWYLLTSEFMNQGFGEDAMRAAQSAIQYLPASAAAAKLATQTFITYRRFEMALPMANRWRELSLDNTFEPDTTIAYIEWQLNRANPALARLEPWRDRIIQNGAEQPETLELYASLLARAGRVDETHELLWPLAQDDPDWAASYARIAEQIAATDDASAWLARAESLPMDAAAMSVLVMEYYKLAQRLQTESSFRKVIDVASSEYEREGFVPAVIMMIADAHQQVGQMDDAERLYRMGVEREPKNALGLNNLAYLLYLTDKLDGDAEEIANRAVSIAGDLQFNPATRANFMETLGLILNSKGKHEDALKVLKEASSLDPSNPSIFLDLTEAYLATDQTDLARNSLTTVDQLLQRRDRQLSAREKDRLAEIRSTLGG